MNDLDPLVSAALDAQVPSRPDRRPAWDDVLDRAGVARVTGPQQTTTTWLPRWQWRRVILVFSLVVVGVVVTGSALATLGYHPLGGLSAPAGHRPGSLDTSFARGGKLTTRIGAVGAAASALAIQQNGKLAAAGSSYHGPGESTKDTDSDFALVRYHANGTLDGSFGGGGKVTTPISSANDGASALAIRKDGKLVAAGGSGGPWGGDFTLARYHANGTLDGSFGRGGKVTTSIGQGWSGASALAIQKDGKLVAAGFGNYAGGATGSFALVRYNANGTLDTSFGRGGIVTTPIGSSGSGVSALAIQKDGKLVAAGGSAIVRYNANGTLDTSFGRGGKVTTPISAATLAIQQDGKLVAAGSSNNGSDTDFALVRYHANGKLDTSFGRGGKVTTPIGSGAGFSGVSALAIQQDGKLVAAGTRGNIDTDADFALVRYNANGTLDGSFGRGGKVTTPIGSSGSGVSALVIQKDGKLVAAGVGGGGLGGGFALVRYWP